MEITVRTTDLLKELLLIQGVVERKTTIPILSQLLVEAGGDGQIHLAATDLELAISTNCPAKIKKSGSGAVPARKLLDYVRLLPDADLSIKLLENHYVQLRCGRASTRMVGMSRENFPELAAFPSTPPARIPGAVLARMIRKTIFAIASEEARYTLNGAQMVLKPESIALVATDGHRLAHVADDHTAIEGVPAEIRCLVPRKAMVELQKLIDELPEGGTVEFGQDETNLFFSLPLAGGGRRVLAARQLTGQFPNYEAVLPKDNARVCVLPSEPLTQALRRVAQFADERSHAVKLRLEKDHLTLTSSSSEAGEADEELDTPYQGEPMVIGFNSQYLLDFLAVAGSEEVRLELKDEQSAGQFRPQGGDGDQYRYIVMPMRI